VWLSKGSSKTEAWYGQLELSEANDSAGDAGAGVARGLAELVPAHTEVVGVRVHHQRAPDYAVRARQRDLRVLDAHLHRIHLDYYSEHEY
jgi:hypothetical protein